MFSIPQHKANEVQIGGDHYKSQYQHWDWAINVGLDYLGSAATKYITRWQKKDGLKDLQKAGHYMDKLIEVAPLVIVRLQIIRPNLEFILCETRKFIRENQLGEFEAAICKRIATWMTTDELHTARGMLNSLIISESHSSPTGPSGEMAEQLKGTTPPDTPKPVPLEDSNKHAERAK